MSATDWSDVHMAELLATGTVTLLLADVVRLVADGIPNNEIALRLSFRRERCSHTFVMSTTSWV